MAKVVFTLGNAEDYFNKLVAPSYEDFLAKNSDVRAALSTTIFGYHLYEKQFGKKFRREEFEKAPPSKVLDIETLDLARKISNSTKHSNVQIVTVVQPGFDSGFSSGFARPLNVKLEDGRKVSMDEFLERLVSSCLGKRN